MPPHHQHEHPGELNHLGKPSVKHLECYWWRTKGSCKWGDKCVYAHHLTGMPAEAPRQVDLKDEHTYAGKQLDHAIREYQSRNGQDNHYKSIIADRNAERQAHAHGHGRPRKNAKGYFDTARAAVASSSNIAPGGVKFSEVNYGKQTPEFGVIGDKKSASAPHNQDEISPKRLDFQSSPLPEKQTMRTWDPYRTTTGATTLPYDPFQDDSPCARTRHAENHSVLNRLPPMAVVPDPSIVAQCNDLVNENKELIEERAFHLRKIGDMAQEYTNLLQNFDATQASRDDIARELHETRQEFGELNHRKEILERSMAQATAAINEAVIARNKVLYDSNRQSCEFSKYLTEVASDAERFKTHFNNLLYENSQMKKILRGMGRHV